jgi:hypothetical protein
MLMPQIYTENDLLLYLYGELSPAETLKLEKELAINNTLQLTLNSLQSSIGLIAQLEEEPSKTSVALVLEYAKMISETSAEKV